MNCTLEDIKKSGKISTYVKMADKSLASLGYTEHSFAHVGVVAENAGYILATLGYPAHETELARIVGYMHDIGNIVNRINHSQSGGATPAASSSFYRFQLRCQFAKQTGERHCNANCKLKTAALF